MKAPGFHSNSWNIVHSLAQRDIFSLIKWNKVFHKPQICTEVHRLWHRLALLQLIKRSNWAWELWIRDGEIRFVTPGFPVEEEGMASDGMKAVVTRQVSPWFILRDTCVLQWSDPRHSFHFLFNVTETFAWLKSGHFFRAVFTGLVFSLTIYMRFYGKTGGIQTLL